MIRTQIQLTEEQTRKLRRLAEREGVSVAAAIRGLIDATLGQSERTLASRYEGAAALIGAFRDEAGASDVASDHDAYLAETYGT